MSQAGRDLFAFFNSLPAWAQDEFIDVLDQGYRGALDKRQLASAIQELMSRAERARDSGCFAYLH